MRVSAGLTFLVALLNGVAFSQTAEPELRFEAAEIHVSTPPVTSYMSAPSIRVGFPGGRRYELRNATMLDLITAAWGVDTEAVYGGPNWLDIDRFDVLAKLPVNSNPGNIKPMLQQLLADRFGLVTHNDTRPLRSWALTASMHTQLKEADGSGSSGCQRQNEQSAIPVMSLSCRNTTMEAFAQVLRSVAATYLGKLPLHDLTGLKGQWNFRFSVATQGYMVMAGLSGGEGLSVFEAVEKLGLKLEHRMIPGPVVVVDRVNRKPTDNPPTKQDAALPTQFEITNVKPSAPGATPTGRGFQSAGGRVDLRGYTLEQLILLAWGIRTTDSWGFTNDYMLVGGPKWLSTERFDVVAKATTTDSPVPVDPESLRVMMQSLLADRFRLATHFENRPVTVYGMVASQPKLKKANPASRSECRSIPPGSPEANTNRVLSVSHTCQNTTIAQLAQRLPSTMGSFEHPLVDMTGLKGGWDFTLSWTPALLPVGPDPNGYQTVIEALDKQLGIKLKVQKQPLPVLVVDHVERPTEN